MSEETYADEPLTGETHGDPDEPLRGADPELLDEDPLLEEQPYSVLEDDDDNHPIKGLDSSRGAGSW